MRAVLRSGVMIPLALLAGLSTAAAADEAARTEAKATVERQIEALRRDDAATAYAQAAPAIQGMFPTPDTFIAMVRQGYAAVYRPRSFQIERIEDVGENGLALGAQLQDSEGVDWVALYSLEKQPDGAWRITGCQLKKAPGSSA